MTTNKKPQGHQIDVSTLEQMIDDIEVALDAKDTAVYCNLDCSSAREEVEAAYAALAEYILGAKWGRHSPQIFLRDTGRDWRFRTVYLNGRPLIEVKYKAFTNNRPWVKIISHEEGERLRREWRDENRRIQAAYDEARLDLICDMVTCRVTMKRSFGEWTYSKGEKGGTYCRLDAPRPDGRFLTIGADGALAAARGMVEQVICEEDRESRWDYHAFEWDRTLYGARY